MRFPARRAAAFTLVAAAAALFAGTVPARAALPASQRVVLVAYLNALLHARYASAYALLSADERRYYGTVANLASTYDADRFRILSYRIVGSKSTPRGTVAVVSEHISFVDHAHEAPATADAKVPYGIVSGPNGPVIRDPGHPWHALAPVHLVSENDGIRATVRKISFFTGRVEFVVNFQNRGDVPVTLLPYGRSVLRDEKGTAYHPIATRDGTLTDVQLYTGLRLPASGEYTGFITFATPNRFVPASLRLSLAPALADGGDTPFALDFPVFPLPS
jgi:hypothetical protein